MNILVVHNFYQQAGGEDQVFADEAALLESHGHAVERFTVHNSAIESMGRVELARRTVWNGPTARALADAVRKSGASIVHFHNTFPLISPAAYQAAHKAGAAVVQTLHNYRLICPAATLFREGTVCEKCVSRAIPWPAVSHACYRGSRSASAAVAAMLTINRVRGTYRDDVDAYIALTQFARNKLIEGGLPQERIVVKPNFVSCDPGPGDGGGNFAVFIGRLTEEKGIRFLLDAWRQIGKRLPLKVLGDGPLRGEVEAAAAANKGIHYLGRRPLPEIYDIMGKACVLVFPSLWYEGLPRTIIEAFAKGTPVLASRLGSMTELVTHGEDGLLFEAGNESDLAMQVATLLADPGAMRARARARFENAYTAGQNYPVLMSVYETALNRVSSGIGKKSSQTTNATNGVAMVQG